MMFIVYAGDDEIIVTTANRESKMLKLWFEEGGRNREDYDRSEILDEAVELQVCIKVC